MGDEVKRRAVHASGAGLPLLYILGAPASLVTWEYIQILAVVGVVITLVLEGLRLFVGLDWQIYDSLTREYEQDNLAGYALYMIGMAVVALAFEPAIALPAMLMLAIGDPVSGLLGSGELRNAKKASVLLVMFLVCFALAIAFVGLIPAILGAFVATLADGVKPVIAGYVIDDNLTIPIGGGLAMYAGVTYLPPML